MAAIVSYADRFGDRSLREHAARNPSFIGDFTPPAIGVALGVATEAFVNGGRWLALCQTESCNGAEYVNLDELLFFCCECRNAESDHHAIRVVLPDAKTRKQVEAYLGARPAWETRNWHPTETVAQLRAENREHGIRLEKGTS